MCITEIKTTTFWNLLKLRSIEIPKIQRDYAHGRNNIKTEIIRNNILDAFYESIKNSKKLNLDFVYGTITKENKLIPLDGQQRLTTLFLLHWYLASISGRLNPNSDNFSKETKKIFSKFTYETRLSSRRFCDALVNNHFNFDSTKNLSVQIMDNSWFYFTWKKDPTIKAMLTMLDSIDTKFKGRIEFWNNLTSVDLIEFEFLPLNKFNLTDELYVKMNARGKALSDFENFKSWLDEKLDEKTDTNFKREWSLKLDTIWTDLFWRNDNGDFSIDEEMMNFFRGMAMFNYTEKFEDTNDKKEFEKRIGELNNIKDNYISNNEFGSIFFIGQKSDIFSQINNFLDFYNSNENIILDVLKKVFLWKKGDHNLFLNFIQEPSFSQRVLFFGLLKYILKKGDQFKSNEREVIRYFRVLRNLVANSEINASNLKNILTSVDNLVEADDVLVYLANENNKLPGFNGAQNLEEHLKAILIFPDLTNQNKGNIDWENQITEIENHPLFKGSISFILPQNETYSLNDFILRKKISMLLFNEQGVNIDKNSNLLGRSLLALGLGLINDYEVWLGGKANQYWKKILQDKNINLYVLKAIDLLSNHDFESFEEILESYVQNVLTENDDLPYWKLLLLKTPSLFKNYTCYGRIKKDWRGINLYEQQKFNSNANAILIENNRNEVITYCIDELKFKLKHSLVKKCGSFYTGENVILLKQGTTLVFKRNTVKVKIKEIEFEKNIDFTSGIEALLAELDEK